jgi:hypothetical protein
MRTLILPLALALSAAPLAAQSNDPDLKVKGGGALPTGWEMRLDRANASATDVKFITMGDGYHATLGPAAIFYQPTRTARGEYRATATFTQTKAPQHPEAYGLFVGGKELGSAEKQSYLYFLVRQDGKFMIKQRNGAETRSLVEWTEHAAVKKADAEGKATNALAIQVEAAKLRFLVNGTEVAALDRTAVPATDGVVGLRVNHNLDVHIANFAVEGAKGGR